MSIELQQGLMITAIGMGLVFVVIIFLWWMMSLLVKATTKPEKLEDAPLLAEHEEIKVPEMARAERLRRSAAAAAAVVLAIEAKHKQRASIGTINKAEGVSPWQSTHRARQLDAFNKRG